MNTQTHQKTLWMVQTAILSAILILMAFTPLGYLKVGVVSITFLTLPVIIAAVLIGPWSGLVLGTVFGLTSFAQCFGLDAFGTTLMGINPVLTFIMCMIPRMIMGLSVGLIFRALAKVDKKKTVSFIIASLSGPVINTVLFVGALVWFFGNSAYLRQFGANIPAILGVLVTINALIEAVVCMIAGTAITKALSAANSRTRRDKPTAA